MGLQTYIRAVQSAHHVVVFTVLPGGRLDGPALAAARSFRS